MIKYLNIMKYILQEEVKSEENKINLPDYYINYWNTSTNVNRKKLIIDNHLFYFELHFGYIIFDTEDKKSTIEEINFMLLKIWDKEVFKKTFTRLKVDEFKEWLDEVNYLIIQRIKDVFFNIEDKHSLEIKDRFFVITCHPIGFRKNKSKMLNKREENEVISWLDKYKIKEFDINLFNLVIMEEFDIITCLQTNEWILLKSYTITKDNIIPKTMKHFERNGLSKWKSHNVISYLDHNIVCIWKDAEQIIYDTWIWKSFL